jgi:parallel beta-helix repeat protein
MYDIDGQPRYDVGWDIGADEAATPIYRSVGLHANDLSEGGKTVTISVATNTATALFSADLPANVGVGDVIQYGNPLTLAFITGRTSSSTYSVQSATGTAPVATSSASVAVYRAHRYLNDWENQVLGDVNQSINAGVQPQVLVNQNLVASNTVMMVPCYASSTADNQSVSISGWTTATTSYVNLFTPSESIYVGASQRHNGSWDDTKYRIEPNDDSGGAIIIYDYFSKVEGLQISNTTYSRDYAAGLALSSDGDSNGGGSVIVGNIIRNRQVDNSNHNGILYSANISKNSYGINNLIYGYNLSSGACIRGSSVGVDVNIYLINNTIFSCNDGISASDSNRLILFNNVAFNNTDDFAGTFTLLDHNASDDGDGTNAISLGSSTAIWKATFTDYENGDFSIRNMASPLYNAGTPIISVTSDILGTPRPYYEAYDIGAFEFKAVKPEFRFSPGGNFKFEGDFKFE